MKNTANAVFFPGYLCRRRHKVALIAEQNLTFARNPSTRSVCGMGVSVKKTGAKLTRKAAVCLLVPYQ